MTDPVLFGRENLEKRRRDIASEPHYIKMILHRIAVDDLVSADSGFAEKAFLVIHQMMGDAGLARSMPEFVRKKSGKRHRNSYFDRALAQCDFATCWND